MSSYSPHQLDFNNPTMTRVIADIRAFMRDYPELNRLTKGVDHSNRHIYWSVLDTLSDWAATPPFIGQDLQMIIDRNWTHLLYRGVVIALLESLGILHMRNELTYSDGGLNVKTENPRMIQAWTQAMKNEYEQKKQRALIALNIDNALDLGGVHSEYIFVNSFWGSW